MPAQGNESERVSPYRARRRVFFRRTGLRVLPHHRGKKENSFEKAACLHYNHGIKEGKMNLSIKHQEKYSRGQLILRTLLGAFTLRFPISLLLAIVGIWSAIISFLTFWVVLFTGRFPESFFNFQIGYHKWYLRVAASLGVIARWLWQSRRRISSVLPVREKRRREAGCSPARARQPWACHP